jgi:hypothetical protein
MPLVCLIRFRSIFFVVFLYLLPRSRLSFDGKSKVCFDFIHGSDPEVVEAKPLNSNCGNGLNTIVFLR